MATHKKIIMKEYKIQYGKEINQALSIEIDKNYIRIKDRNSSIYSELILSESAKIIKKQLEKIFHGKSFQTAKEIFTDWNKITENNWSNRHIILNYTNTDNEDNTIEIGLYREENSLSDSYYQLEERELPKKDLTLHVFIGDEVIFCYSIW